LQGARSVNPQTPESGKVPKYREGPKKKRTGRPRGEVSFLGTGSARPTTGKQTRGNPNTGTKPSKNKKVRRSVGGSNLRVKLFR